MEDILFNSFCVLVSLLGVASLVLYIRSWSVLNGYPWIARFSDASPRSSFSIESTGHYCVATIGFRITSSGHYIRVSRSGTQIQTKTLGLPFGFRRHGQICFEYVAFEIKEPGTYEIYVDRNPQARKSTWPGPFSQAFSQKIDANIDFGIRREVRVEDLLKNGVLLLVGLAFLQLGIFMYFRVIA